MSAARRTAATAACLALAIAASGLTGCGNRTPPPEPTRTSKFRPRVITPIDVVRIDLGTAANPDGTITTLTSSFKPNDTIIAAVNTQRPGHGIKLTARWMSDDGTVIKEQSKTIDPANQAVTDFQVTNDAGWPSGQYKLEMQVNGQAVAVTSFSVTR